MPVPCICVFVVPYSITMFVPGERGQLPMPNFIQKERDVIFYPGVLDDSNLFIFAS